MCYLAGVKLYWDSDASNFMSNHMYQCSSGIYEYPGKVIGSVSLGADVHLRVKRVSNFAWDYVMVNIKFAQFTFFQLVTNIFGTLKRDSLLMLTQK